VKANALLRFQLDRARRGVYGWVTR